jgi:hypothetical protein
MFGGGSLFGPEAYPVLVEAIRVVLAPCGSFILHSNCRKINRIFMITSCFKEVLPC